MKNLVKLFSTMKKTLCLVIVCVVGSLILGCESFDNVLLDPNIQIQDHAVLYLQKTLQNITIDNVKVASSGDTFVLVPPGEHAVRARYYKETWVFVNTIITSTDYTTVTCDFKPDTYYYMYSVLEDKKTKTRKFSIIEDTDQSRIKKGTEKKNSLIK